MLENLDGIMVTGLDKIKKKANEKGITILEALVSTAIIGIGFIGLQIAQHQGYINIDWFKLKDEGTCVSLLFFYNFNFLFIVLKVPYDLTSAGTSLNGIRPPFIV